MPKGAAPAGTGIGDDDSSVRLPPSTAKALTACAPVSTTQSVWPLGASRASCAPAKPIGVLPSRPREPSAAIAKREMLRLAVLTVKSTCPSWLISTQQGAVWRSGNGDEPIDVNVPSVASLKAEIVPVPGPTLWALETKKVGRIGRAELAPKRAEALRGKRRGRRSRQASIRTNGEAVDQRGADPRSNELGSVAVEENITGRGPVRQGNGRAGQRPQVAARIEREARVVGAAVAGVGDVDLRC